MKIATYNVNGINGRLPVLMQWLSETSPDIVCLQELKAPQDKFPLFAIQELGYQAIWHGQKSWNGVAILSKGSEPVEITRVLPGDPEDTHSRYIEATVGTGRDLSIGKLEGTIGRDLSIGKLEGTIGRDLSIDGLDEITIGCLYLPNGNPVTTPKFEFKLKWFERLTAHAAQLIASGKPVVLTGDFNVMPTEIDVYKPERWVNDALFRPEVRAAFHNLLSQGWTDAIRHLYPDQVIYTFWDYFRDNFKRNTGLRIDHFLLSPALAPRLKSAGVDTLVRSWEKTSDHAPVWIELFW